jgi:hypothetical protein
MIVLNSLQAVGMQFRIISGDLCAYAQNNYSITGAKVIDITTPDPVTGKRDIKIVLIKKVGDFQVTYTDGRYIVDNNSEWYIAVGVDYVNTKKQRGRVITATQWAKSAREGGRVSEAAMLLEDSAFSRATYDSCGVGGFYVVKAKV